MSKKFLALFLAVLMVLSLAACGAKAEQPAPQQQETASQPETTEASGAPATLMDKPMVLKFGCSETEETALVQEMKAAAERIAERTNGEISIEIYANNQLGSKNDMVEQMTSGVPIMLANDFNGMASYVDGVGVAGYPYIFEDIYDIYALEKSDWGIEANEKMLEAGFAPIAYTAYGYRHFISTKQITCADDCKGLIMRMSPDPAPQKFITLLGGSPTTSSWVDNYSLLQSGAIDSCEAALDLLWSSSLYEVCDYLCLSGHFITPNIFMTSADIWNQIPAEYQDVLREEIGTAARAITDAAVANEASFVEKFKEAGVTVSEADKESFAAVVPELYKACGEDPGMYDVLMEAIAQGKTR